MSLLGEIHGVARGPSAAGVDASLRLLCEAVLSRNRLPAHAVVAARILVPADTTTPTDVPRALGWNGIPIFWEAQPDGRDLKVIAHVRLKRRRRLMPVVLEAS